MGVGAAGDRIVVEECLEGEEASLFALCDGRTALEIGTAQDHKRAFDGDRGPNTGGMGAYSPAPRLDAATTERVMAEIVRPTLAGMAAEGAPFTGILYAGLMLTAAGPKLIEFNVRFGDPEAQVVLPRGLDEGLAEAPGLRRVLPHLPVGRAVAPARFGQRMQRHEERLPVGGSDFVLDAHHDRRIARLDHRHRGLGPMQRRRLPELRWPSTSLRITERPLGPTKLASAIRTNN